ncbi:MAG: hypothetical protein J7J06_05615 [Methanosarcinales archaeon]|nr:hypothetical protein [Methanosarcinales archaeon]
MTHVGSIFDTYSLILASVLTLSLFAIGRFYQLKFDRKTYYGWFLLPAALFVVAAVLCALGYDGIIAACAGAAILLILTIILYKIMMRIEK